MRQDDDGFDDHLHFLKLDLHISYYYFQVLWYIYIVTELAAFQSCHYKSKAEETWSLVQDYKSQTYNLERISKSWCSRAYIRMPNLTLKRWPKLPRWKPP